VNLYPLFASFAEFVSRDRDRDQVMPVEEEEPLEAGADAETEAEAQALEEVCKSVSLSSTSYSMMSGLLLR
jgi:hypothetical protein